VYKRPLVIGVKQLAAWDSTTTVEQGLQVLGANSGNMMFTEALVTVLGDARLTGFDFTAADLDARDCIVLAAANWVNHFEDYGWLADKLEKTELPVFLVGLGSQAATAAEFPDIAAGTRRLLALVQDRTKSIAARGVYSAQILRRHGFKAVTVTGCPSLLLAGPEGVKLPETVTLDRVCLHATRHKFNGTSAFQAYLYRQALKLDADLVLQSEHADIYFALGRTNNPEILDKATAAVLRAYGVDDIGHPATYLRNRGRFFLNYASWIRYMKTRSFCVGTRIHGTVAALLAGTPATLITHDIRTLELAQAMNIPYVEASSIATDKDLDLASLVRSDQLMLFAAGYCGYYRNFMSYFDAVGLPVSAAYRPGAELSSDIAASC
jgi:hypothetical protein